MMSGKPVSILLIDLGIATAAMLGLFIALTVFQLPNCTSVETQPLLVWCTPLAIVLVMGCAGELVIGAREGSRLSRAIGALCALAAVLLVLAYRAKLGAISTMAC